MVVNDWLFIENNAAPLGDDRLLTSCAANP
jgi:hypothetical protein